MKCIGNNYFVPVYLLWFCDYLILSIEKLVNFFMETIKHFEYWVIFKKLLNFWYSFMIWVICDYLSFYA